MLAETPAVHQALRILIVRVASRGHTNTQYLLVLAFSFPYPHCHSLPSVLSLSLSIALPQLVAGRHSFLDSYRLLRLSSHAPPNRQHEAHHCYRPCPGRRGLCLSGRGQWWVPEHSYHITLGPLLTPPSPRQAPEHRDQPRRLGPGHDGRQRERRPLRGQQGLPGQQGQGAISVFSSSTLGHHDNGAMGHPAPIRVDYAARLHTTMRH